MTPHALPSLWLPDGALTLRGRHMVAVFRRVWRGGAVGLREVCDVLHMTSKHHVRDLCDEMVARGFLRGWRDMDKPNAPYVYDVADVFRGIRG